MAFRCTLQLQLGPGLGFDEARELVSYLRDLGVSHLYLSPSLQARAGSTHGNDVVDPTRISKERGGEDAFRALCAAAQVLASASFSTSSESHGGKGVGEPVLRSPTLLLADLAE